MDLTRNDARWRRRCTAANRRTGGVYVAVLGVALIICVVAMASLHLARTETDVLTGADQIANAELLSQSAVEFAIARIMANSSWRIDHTSGVDAPSSSGLTVIGGTIKYTLTDATDGNLNDDARDVITLRGVGRTGEATQVTTVQLEPITSPLSCLQVGFLAGGNVTVAGAVVTTDRTFASNGNINASSGTISGDASAVGTISGAVTGVSTPGAVASALPNEAELWAYYLANGTAINIASIPNQRIEDVVLSATNNPYGAKNPQGIYIINTQGQTLRIRNSRIAATLVVISPAAVTEIEQTINWAPPAPNFPALLVNGNLTLEWSGGSSLSEASATANFNPTGTPYENIADTDQTDSYPGVIKGLVYATGNLSVTSPCVMQGSLYAAGTASVTGTLMIAYSGSPQAFPPPGFATGNLMHVIPRTWRRVAQ